MAAELSTAVIVIRLELFTPSLRVDEDAAAVPSGRGKSLTEVGGADHRRRDRADRALGLQIAPVWSSVSADPLNEWTRRCPRCIRGFRHEGMVAIVADVKDAPAGEPDKPPRCDIEATHRTRHRPGDLATDRVDDASAPLDPLVGRRRHFCACVGSDTRSAVSNTQGSAVTHKLRVR